MNFAVADDRLILSFHGLGPVTDRVPLAERGYWCDEDRFSSILNFICTLPQRDRIEITFDDGNMSDAIVALPALANRGLIASFFVCAGRIGLPGYLDSAAMNDIISSGKEIGSHGWAHVDWRRVDDKTLDVEIDDSRKRIADVIGRAVDKIAIPFGSYDRWVLSRLRRSEIRTVYTSDRGRAPLAGWMLPRETYRKSSWDDAILVETIPRRLSRKAIRRSVVVGLIKRLR